MKVKREVNSLPKRSALDTWSTIVGLVTGKDSVDKSHLESIAGIVASVITEEAPKDAPFVFHGSGPRLVVYCRFNGDAMEEENIDALNWNPTQDAGWRLAVPCGEADMDWVSKAIAKKTSRVAVYDAAEGYEEEEAIEASQAAGFAINWNAEA